MLYWKLIFFYFKCPLCEYSSTPDGDHEEYRPGGGKVVFPESCLKDAIHSQLNWAILLCDVILDGKKLSKLRSLTGNSAGPRNFLVVFHTENSAVHSGNPTLSSVCLPTPRWHHLKAHPFLAIHSADEHRMIYSFSQIPLLTPHLFG